MNIPPVAIVDPSPEPLGDFSRCHEGIVSRLGALARLPALLDAADQARAVAADTLRLFDEGVLAHHLDEEKVLFPSVQRSAMPGDEAALVEALAERLTREHRDVESQWKALEAPLKAAARGKPAALEAPAVQRLVATYLAHARFEETHYLPLAARILGRNANHLAALDASLHIRHAPLSSPAYI